MHRQLTTKPNIRRDIIFSVVVIIAFFGILGFWAGFAPLESAAIATGKVIVSGYQKDIQHLEGGIVTRIAVKDGDVVKRNQVLLILKKTQAQSSLSITQHQLLESKAAVLRIQAELDNQAQFNLQQNANFAHAPQVIKIQQSIFTTNKKVFTNTLHIHQQQIRQLQQQVVGLQEKIKANDKQHYFIEKELKDIRVLAEKRLVKQSRLLSLEREAARLTGTQADHHSQIAQTEQKINEVKIEITKLENDHRQQLLEQLKQEYQKVKDLSEQQTAQHDILKRTVIRSPIAGTVVGLKVHTVGAVVKPGEILMNIVPRHETLVVEVRLNPLDIDVVHRGLLAQVRVASFNQRTTPLLTGKVLHVSANALVDQTTGKAYYLAQINIPKSEIAKLPAADKLYPGMPVEAMIVTNKLTPWEYFVAPVQRSFNRAFREE